MPLQRMHRNMNRFLLISLPSLLLLTGGGMVILEHFRHRADAPHASRREVSENREIPMPVPYRPSRMPDRIAQLTDPALHHSRRLEVVRSLPDDLTNEEFDDLMGLIRGPMPDRLSADDWHEAANEIMKVLREPGFHIRSYGDSMAGLVLDQTADPVIRDYAAQHLALTLDRVTHDPTPADFHLAMNAFLKVVADEHEAFNGVTGTILMSLSALSETFHHDDLAPYRARLGAAIVALATGVRNSSMSNRISAIQAAGRLGFPEALPAIRELARGPAPKPSIRLSSVAALGYFHQPEDREFLHKLAANDDALSKVAEAALRNYPSQ